MFKPIEIDQREHQVLQIMHQKIESGTCTDSDPALYMKIVAAWLRERGVEVDEQEQVHHANN